MLWLSDIDLIDWNGFRCVPWNLPEERAGVYLIIHIKSEMKYVGISANVKRRLRSHGNGYGKCHKLNGALGKYGRESFLAWPFCYSISGSKFLPGLESELISEFSSVRNGFNLKESDGGVGPYGPEYSEMLRRVFSNPVLIAKVAKSNKAAYQRKDVQERHRAAINRPECKARQAEAKRLVNATTDINARRSASSSKAWQDPEKRRQVAERMRKLFSDPNKRAERAKLISIALNNPEVLAKISKSSKESYTPERLARHSKTGRETQNRPEVKQKQRDARRDRTWITDGSATKWVDSKLPIPEGWRPGRGPFQKPEGLSAKGRMWITDGTETRHVPATEAIPNGWRRGRSDGVRKSAPVSPQLDLF